MSSFVKSKVRYQEREYCSFDPGDNHACVQNDDGTLGYRGFNITKEVMLNLVEEITGRRELPGFHPV